MLSREERTDSGARNDRYIYLNKDRILFEIALSLGRIADMLAEQNGYNVYYSKEDGGKRE